MSGGRVELCGIAVISSDRAPANGRIALDDFGGSVDGDGD